jgi:hypothetical protein
VRQPDCIYITFLFLLAALSALSAHLPGRNETHGDIPHIHRVVEHCRRRRLGSSSNDAANGGGERSYLAPTRCGEVHALPLLILEPCVYLGAMGYLVPVTGPTRSRPQSACLPQAQSKHTSFSCAGRAMTPPGEGEAQTPATRPSWLRSLVWRCLSCWQSLCRSRSKQLLPTATSNYIRWLAPTFSPNHFHLFHPLPLQTQAPANISTPHHIFNINH